MSSTAEHLSLESTSAENLLSTSVVEDQAGQCSNIIATPDTNNHSFASTTESDSVITDYEITHQSPNVSYSLSASLANTRKFVSELLEILDEQKVPPKKGKKTKSTARVLTSAESLALIIATQSDKTGLIAYLKVSRNAGLSI